ncbi:MAG: RiPP maturation radical SAM protein 1 [Gammaproteobacteria bacterium]|nr:RiPP maturation radical SAM protein 1 [Gammaproteobacteria bacterium]
MQNEFKGLPDCDVALVNMPIVTSQTPSLGLSLLKAELEQRSIASVIHYLNIDFAEKVGLEVLADLETLPTAQLVGDWIFSASLWGEDEARDRQYIEQVLKDQSNEHPHHDNRCISDEMLQRILVCRAQVESFLEECLLKIDWSRYKIVGFTSMFQQHMAALAFAKRLKAAHPDIIIVFGGANCADDMGRAVIENFDFVDAVSLGMAEQVFAEFVSAILQGKTPNSYQDFVIRGNIASWPQAQKSPENMNTVPFPNFDDFFFQRVDQSTLPDERLSMMVETSRGCWWGQKHHCTFCGLNNATMNYRFKSAERAMDEFLYLTERYGQYTSTVAVVDNIIPMDYMRSFLPMLRDSELKLDIFYETKANLKKEHLQLYRDAGLNIIQPGIESFSDRLLKLMKKGITGLQNVQFLKWCREFGVRPVWNYLAGFPGEVAEDHYQQLKWFPLLSHLYPPDVSWIRIDRFSPYHSNPEQYGIKNLRPFSAFEYLYPGLAPEQRARVAYYFIGEYEVAEEMFEYSNQVNDAVNHWKDEFEWSSLFYFDSEELLTIVDDRDCAVQSKYQLSGLARWLYLQCDHIRNLDKLTDEAIELGLSQDAQEVSQSLQELVNNRLMLVDNHKYLALAVSIEYEYFPPQHTWQRAGMALL